MGHENGSPADPARALETLRRLGAELADRAAPEHGRAMQDALAAVERLLHREPPGTPEDRDAKDAARVHYQELFDFAPDGYLVTDTQGVVTRANHTAVAMLRCRGDFLVGKPLAFFVTPGQRRAFYTLLAGLKARGGGARNWTVRLAPPDAGLLVVSLSVSAVVAPGWPGGYRWLLRDITDQARAEHELCFEKDFADGLLDTARAIVLVVDPGGRVVRANRFLRDLTGYDDAELRAANWLEVLADRDRAPAAAALTQALALGTTPSFNATLTTRRSSPRTVAWTARALSQSDSRGGTVLLVGHDITEFLEAQEQAVQSERLAAIGQVIATLAHESRNLLQRSKSCLERLGWRLQDRPEELELLRRARTAQDGLALLFEDLRSYAAPIKLELGPCHLADVWREAWAQVHATQPERAAELREDCGGLDLWCTADCFRVSQVFRNVIENAFAACPGPVEIEFVCRPGNLGDRDAVRVAVRDNGPGLTEEQRRRFGEPFFTTKSAGTGLGMAIARRVMEAHGGHIFPSDDPPQGGAEIILFFPRSPSS